MSRMTLMMVRTDITLGRKVVMISNMALVMGKMVFMALMKGIEWAC